MRLSPNSQWVWEQHTHGNDGIQLQTALGTFPMELILCQGTARDIPPTALNPPMSLISCASKGRCSHTLEPLPTIPPHLVVVSTEVFEVPKADVT